MDIIESPFIRKKAAQIEQPLKFCLYKISKQRLEQSLLQQL